MLYCTPINFGKHGAQAEASLRALRVHVYLSEMFEPLLEYGQ